MLRRQGPGRQGLIEFRHVISFQSQHFQIPACHRLASIGEYVSFFNPWLVFFSGHRSMLPFGQGDIVQGGNLQHDLAENSCTAYVLVRCTKARRLEIDSLRNKHHVSALFHDVSINYLIDYNYHHIRFAVKMRPLIRAKDSASKPDSNTVIQLQASPDL